MNSDEAKELIVKARQGDIEARNKVLESCYKIIGKECHKYKDWKDMFQEGILTVINIINKRDIEHEGNFYAYVKVCVKYKMFNYLFKNKYPIRMPSSVRRVLKSFNSLKHENPNLSDEEIIDMVVEDKKTTVKNVHNVLCSQKEYMFIDHNMVYTQPSVSSGIRKVVVENDLELAISKLSKRHKEIARMKFRGCSIDEIMKKMGLSRKQVYHHNGNLVRRLKKHTKVYGNMAERLLSTEGTSPKKVYQYEKDGTFVKEWVSIKRAAVSFNPKDNTHRHTIARSISRIANGRGKTAHGYKWSFAKI